MWRDYRVFDLQHVVDDGSVDVPVAHLPPLPSFLVKVSAASRSCTYDAWLGGNPENVIRLAGALLICAAIAVLFVTLADDPTRRGAAAKRV